MSDFGFEPADAEGFRLWRPAKDGRFIDSYGPIRARAEGPAAARCRVAVGRAQSNVGDSIHGGFILAFIDQAIFTGPFLLERLVPGGSVTFSVSANFMAPGRIDRPLDALVEIIGETGRTIFLRGMIEQGEVRVASFEATLRKAPARAGQVARNAAAAGG